MKKHDPVDRDDAAAARSSRRARLQALLFAGAALGTTLVMLAPVGDPKLPIVLGD